MNKKIFLSLIFLLGGYSVFADTNVKIEGSPMKIIEVKPESSTGLNNIFVVFNTRDCRFTFTSGDTSNISVSKFSSMGGGYSQEVSNIEKDQNSVSFPLTSEDLGYIIDVNGKMYYYWIVNYANHEMSLNNISPSEDTECDYSVLKIDGSASPINYYTINGQPRVLSREIKLEYTTQIFNKEIKEYEKINETKVYESISNYLSVSPPAYCSTYFTLSGDRFLSEWGRELIAQSMIIQPSAVSCETEAVQVFSEEGSNVMKGDSNELGGSAPADISFLAHTTDAVIHYEWQMCNNTNFENPEYRFYQQDLDYTFTETGTWYLRFIGTNSEGTCETIGDTYTVSIGESALECPNAFSPNGDGVNDIWKVSYRSLINFHCEIFNRNGQLIYSFDDPSNGWDGTWHGKTVKPGVYYYVIVAEGSDSKQYKKSGDINIINSRIFAPGSQQPDLSE